MKAVTYKEFCERVKDPILMQSDETVQNAVYDWFKYRLIGFSDEDKFLDILRRNVAINYPIYKQKLRIEPGVSQYDWLVETYRERQFKSQGTTNSAVKYGALEETTTGGEATDIRTGGQTATKTGTDTGIRSGNETTKDTGALTNIKTGNETQAKTGTDSDVKTGGHTQTDTAGLHTTTTSPHVSRKTTESGGDNAWSGDWNVNSTLPMSKSYDKFITTSDDTDEKQHFEKAFDHMPSGLDWDTVSAQAQTGHREYHDNDRSVTESYVYGDGEDGDIQTTQGDADNPDTHKTVYDDEKTARNYDSTDTHTYNDVTDTQNHDTLSTHTYNDVTDTQTHDTTDKLVYDDVTDTHRNSGNSTTQHGGTDTTTGSNDHTDREQVTGRNADPATLLARATAFIESSSAFMWFKAQIDTCFYPGYYIEEDDDGTAEGSCNI